MSRQANIIERHIDHIVLENIKSFVVNLIQAIQEEPCHALQTIDEHLGLLEALAHDGAETFREWQICPECGNRWTTEQFQVSFYCDSYGLEFNCPFCEELLLVRFRPTKAPEILPF